VRPAAGAAEDATERPLLPVPAHVERGDGFLSIEQSFSVSFEGVRSPLLDRAAARFIGRLRAKTGIPAAVVPAAPGTGTLRIRCAASDPAYLTDRADERYTLDVTASEATLSAPAPTGVLRGLATFLQLVRLDATGVRAPAVRVDDAPRFAWRGFMLDVSRHFSRPDVVLRTLDAMEAVKLNVLHLHLSDNEGFRVESLRYPKLHAAPSSGGEYYTQAEVRAIVAAARDRGIRVVPEFELPGHTQSVLIAYPELGSGSVAFTPGRTQETMNAALDPTREATYRFVAGLLGEMAALFPDRMMHVAGDEVTGVHWRQSPRIRAFMAARSMTTTHDLQAYFTGRVVGILKTLGKTPIVWDEALGPDLPNDVVVQAWRSSKMAQRAAAAGHPTIVSAGYYLDHGLPAATHYAVDPSDSRATGVPPQMLQSVKGTPLEPFVTEAMVAADAPELTDAERARVIGGETALWTELIEEQGVEMHAWPRAAAVAERLWSPATVRDAASMQRRLAVVSTELALQGLRHREHSVLALERLAAGGDVAPLATLAGAVEPQRFLARLLPAMMAPMSTPGVYFLTMNRFADAVPPESPVAAAFNEAAARMASKAGDDAARALVRARLEAWRDNEKAFKAASERSALLQEVVQVSDNVVVLAALGLEALEAIERGTPLDTAKVTSMRAALRPYVDEVAANDSVVAAFTVPHPPHGLAIAIVPGVAALIEVAAR
jgi:hexosaminidase